MQPCKTKRFHTFSNSSTNCMNSVFLLVLIIFQSTSLSSQPTIKILKLKENILHHFTPRGDQNINYLYSINTISSSQVTKKAKKFYLWDYHLIQHQILRTNLIINVWQTVRRIFFEILWVKGLRELTVKELSSTTHQGLVCVESTLGSHYSRWDMLVSVLSQMSCLPHRCTNQHHLTPPYESLV